MNKFKCQNPECGKMFKQIEPEYFTDTIFCSLKCLDQMENIINFKKAKKKVEKLFKTQLGRIENIRFIEK